MAVRGISRTRTRDSLLHDARVQAVISYAGTLFLCVILMVWVLKLRSDEFSLHIPFLYVSDGLMNATWIKGMIENGWFIHNSFVGAPTGLNMLDFPMPDNLHFAVMKLISLFSGDYAVVMNLYYLATFPLTAISSLFVFRRLRISYPVAAVGSLLFTFLPYHLLRGEGHLALAGIYVIPLSLLMVIRVLSPTPPLVKQVEGGKGNPGGEAYDFWSLRTLGFAVIAVLIASAGVYYAFFTIFFLFVAGVYAAAIHRSFRRLAVAGIIIAVIFAGLLANLSPNLLYQLENGKNEEVGQRSASMSITLGMTLSQLVMPVPEHRLAPLREIRAEFDKEIGFYVNENTWVSLGFIGSLGFVLSLGWLLYAKGRGRYRDDRRFHMLDSVGVLNLLGILLATMGGISLLVAFFITPQIRAYNRLSVFIGFLSILFVLLVIELLRKKYVSTGVHRLLFFGLLAVVLFGGVLDQTTSAMVPAYHANKAAFASDEEFIQRIEASLPGNSSVFQLPFMPFPESFPVNQMQNLDHFRAYLHSRTIHWSYGAMAWRDDAWQKEVSAMPAGEMVMELYRAGFRGIYINRAGYADSAYQLEKELEDVLKTEPIGNSDNTLIFFDMSNYINETSGQR